MSKGFDYLSLLRQAIDAEAKYDSGVINEEEFQEIINNIHKQSKKIDKENSNNYFKAVIKTLF